MVSRKIAPRLEELVALELKHQAYLLPTHAARTQAELRALLAVARAAEAWRSQHRHLVPCPCQSRFPYTPGDVTVHHDTCEAVALSSALARPSRARRPGEEGTR
jgi:hypothetical protein